MVHFDWSITGSLLLKKLITNQDLETTNEKVALLYTSCLSHHLIVYWVLSIVFPYKNTTLTMTRIIVSVDLNAKIYTCSLLLVLAIDKAVPTVTVQSV